MRFLIDEQLPPLLALALRGRGFDASHVSELGLAGHDDDDVWTIACRDGWVIVSKDADYPPMLRRRPPHCPILWVRLGNVSNARLIEQVDRKFTAAVTAFSDGLMLFEL